MIALKQSLQIRCDPSGSPWTSRFLTEILTCVEARQKEQGAFGALLTSAFRLASTSTRGD